MSEHHGAREKVNKVHKIHPPGTMNVFNILPGITCNTWDISIWTKVVDWQTNTIPVAMLIWYKIQKKHLKLCIIHLYILKSINMEIWLMMQEWFEKFYNISLFYAHYEICQY